MRAFLETMAQLSANEWKSFSAKVGWVYRRNEWGAKMALPELILTYFPDGLSKDRWQEVRRDIVRFRLQEKQRLTAERHEMRRAKRRVYMREYMRRYREQQLLK